MNISSCRYKYSKLFFSELYFQIPLAFRSDQALFINNIPIYDNGPGNANDAITDLKTRLCGRVFAADEDQSPTNVYTGPNTVSVCCKFVCLSSRDLIILGSIQAERNFFFKPSTMAAFNIPVS